MGFREGFQTVDVYSSNGLIKDTYARTNTSASLDTKHFNKTHRPDNYALRVMVATCSLKFNDESITTPES